MIDRAKLKARRARYNRSEKGRARHRRYNLSPKGTVRNRRYEATAKAMRRKLEWEVTNRGVSPEYVALNEGIIAEAEEGERILKEHGQAAYDAWYEEKLREAREFFGGLARKYGLAPSEAPLWRS